MARKGFLFLAIALDLGLSAALAFGTGEPGPHRSLLGINLSGPADWNSELPFVDVFRLSRAWISQEEGKGWGQGPALELDEHGWIRRLAPGCSAETPMCTVGGHYPSGRYVCLYDGKGRIEFSNARIVSRSPGRIEFEPDTAKGGFFLRVEATVPDDYIRGIRVIMPGFEDSYRRQPFNPSFLARWKDMGAIRFMDWMLTNGSKAEEWKDRPTLEDSTWTVKGIPLEVMIDLANRLGVDPWFCMPHRATDDYVRNFAAMVARDLAPGRKAYLEYSNEIWNPTFDQTRYAVEEGKRLGLSKNDWEAGLRFGSLRSIEIFRIWERAFGGSGRFVRVMASQAASANVSRAKLSFRDAYKECDALAIAPYFALSAGPDTDPSAASVARWTTKMVLDYLESRSLPEAIAHMRSSKEIADRFGLRLIAYEAGQHAVGILGSENIDALTELFLAANRSGRMGDLYRRYLDEWAKAGGDLCAVFSSVSVWSKWGSWGLIEHCDDYTPKMGAVIAWNLAHPRKR